MRRSLSTLLLSLSLPVLVVACGSDADPSDHGGDAGHGSASAVADGARRIEVGATSFSYDPSALTVRAGEDVAIALRSDDILHDFTIDDVDVHVAVEGGETAEGGMRIDEAGTYDYYCTVAGHREAGMEGTLTVEAA